MVIICKYIKLWWIHEYIHANCFAVHRHRVLETKTFWPEALVKTESVPDHNVRTYELLTYNVPLTKSGCCQHIFVNLAQREAESQLYTYRCMFPMKLRTPMRFLPGCLDANGLFKPSGHQVQSRMGTLVHGRRCVGFLVCGKLVGHMMGNMIGDMNQTCIYIVYIYYTYIYVFVYSDRVYTYTYVYIYI